MGPSEPLGRRQQPAEGSCIFRRSQSQRCPSGLAEACPLGHDTPPKRRGSPQGAHWPLSWASAPHPGGKMPGLATGLQRGSAQGEGQVPQVRKLNRGMWEML